MSTIQQKLSPYVSFAVPRVFDCCIIFCKYPCFSPSSSVSSICLLLPPAILKNHFFPVLFISQFYAANKKTFLKPPKSHWVGSAWAVARRFVPLANRRTEKTIAVVFQIRLQLVRAKSSFQSPDRL